MAHRDGAAGGVVQLDLVAALGLHDDLLAPGGVVEGQLVPRLGGDAPHVVAPGTIHLLGRGVLAVPEGAEHHRMAGIAGHERDEHFVVHLGDEPGAAVLAGHHRRQAGPGARLAAVLLGEPGELDLHAALPVGVGHVPDQGGVHAVETAGRRRAEGPLRVDPAHGVPPMPTRSTSKQVRRPCSWSKVWRTEQTW